MSIKLSDLSPEQKSALRQLAERKVNKKMKVLDNQAKKEKKWADEQTKISPIHRKLSDDDKVPVRINSRTIVMVDRSKCTKQNDGSWVKITQTL